MRIAYFDCPSGISGDMALGALLDGGAGRALLDAPVEALGLSTEVRIDVRQEERGHTGGLRVLVECDPGGPTRNLPQLERAVEHALLPDGVRSRALDALGRLGRAEAAVHGRPAEELHLHELGGADTLVDLVGAVWLLASLDVAAVDASPPAAPSAVLTAPGPAPALAVS